MLTRFMGLTAPFNKQREQIHLNVSVSKVYRNPAALSMGMTKKPQGYPCLCTLPFATSHKSSGADRYSGMA